MMTLPCSTVMWLFMSSRRRKTRCALVTGVQTCALPISRTAAISGAWVALRRAVDTLLASKAIAEDPIADQVAAISCGIFRGTPVLDLDYDEDSNAEADRKSTRLNSSH